jgi:hypothetical protein
MPGVIDGKEHEVEMLSSSKVEDKSLVPSLVGPVGLEAVSCCAAGSVTG